MASPPRGAKHGSADCRAKHSAVDLKFPSGVRRARMGTSNRKAALEFITVWVHIGSACGGADMPLIGPIPEGETFFCPHCGALYSLTYSRLPKSDGSSIA